MQGKETHALSTQGVRRLPYYLKYLKELEAQNVVYVPSAVIADILGVYEVQVRKDLAAVSSQPGKPRVGFNVSELIADIQHFLGYDTMDSAVLVGAGHLGQALMSYSEFSHYGLDIVAAFDVDSRLVGQYLHGRPVYSADTLAEYCREHRIRIGIITTPADTAQRVCDELIRGQVQAVWNFAHVHLSVPNTILVQNEDMAVSFALLSNRLAQQRGRNDPG